ncbi:MAG: hypothetical protein EKK52_15570 [Burkholderiales bacterium]|nr:MAG: hypothetical protein EKK52_15570 [Burkholderiales bacterium]
MRANWCATKGAAPFAPCPDWPRRPRGWPHARPRPRSARPRRSVAACLLPRAGWHSSRRRCSAWPSPIPRRLARATPSPPQALH